MSFENITQRIFIIIFLFSGTVSASHFVLTGRDALVNRDLVGANQSFLDGVAFDSSDYDANVFYAVTRILILAESSELQTLISNGGASVIDQDFYNYHLAVVEDVDGNPVPDQTFATDEAKNYVLNYVLPELEGAVSNLEVVTLTNYQLVLSAPEANTSSSVTIDYADIVLIKSFLKAIISMLHVAKNYDSDLVLYDIYQLHLDDNLHIQGFLNLYPQYFKRMSANELVDAETCFRDAVAYYNEASDLIRARQALDRLFDLTPGQDTIDEANFRIYLNHVLASLDTPTLLHPVDLGRDIKLHLRPLLDGNVYPEDLYPQFYENYLVEGSIPDVTFDGLFPELTAQDIYDEITLGQYPTFIYEPYSQAFFEGDSGYLWGAATGKPAVTYQWYKNGSPIPSDGDFLNFDNAIMADAADYSLEASNPIGLVTSGPITLTIWPLSNIGTWKSSFLAGQDDSDEADVDNDGTVNLLEYAFGSNPLVSDDPGLKTSYNQGTDELELTYNRYRSDITYSAEASNDLSSWSTSGVTQGNPGLGERTASVQMAPDPHKFIRLKISY